jgi:hypothetical protein
MTCTVSIRKWQTVQADAGSNRRNAGSNRRKDAAG